MLTIVVVIYNMKREAPRTLFTLSTKYQKWVSDEEYEIVVIDNGSEHPFSEGEIEKFGKNFHYLPIGEGALPSPCSAINDAIRGVDSSHVGVIIDGARMVSPGLVRHAIDSLNLIEVGIVATLAWHLGPKQQSLSMIDGYNQILEDSLLDSIGWEDNGYRLFEIASLAWSSSCGFFGNISESNAFFMAKSFYNDLNGFDPDFRMPGGGFANLDFYKRACEDPRSKLIYLLGEGTFHQIHGGIATNSMDNIYVSAASSEYLSIRGESFSPPDKVALLYGRPTKESIRWISMN